MTDNAEQQDELVERLFIGAAVLEECGDVQLNRIGIDVRLALDYIADLEARLARKDAENERLGD